MAVSKAWDRCGFLRSLACPWRARRPSRARLRRTPSRGRYLRIVWGPATVQKLHVPDRVEEMHHQEPLGEGVRLAQGHLGDRIPDVFDAKIAARRPRRAEPEARVWAPVFRRWPQSPGRTTPGGESRPRCCQPQSAAQARGETARGVATSAPGRGPGCQAVARFGRCPLGFGQVRGNQVKENTFTPALATCAAIPLPMTPAPTTPTRRIGFLIRRLYSVRVRATHGYWSSCSNRLRFSHSAGTAPSLTMTSRMVSRNSWRCSLGIVVGSSSSALAGPSSQAFS